MKSSEQHVQLPNNMTEGLDLDPGDILIYITIKRFMNNKTQECFPSISTISCLCSASESAIKAGIKKLEQKGYIEVIRNKGTNNVYRFTKYINFEPFSYRFLDKQDLTFQEKSYIAVSQQYMFKENGQGKISYTNKELSGLVNLSESSISKYNRSLESKGYLQIINCLSQQGLKIKEKFFHLDELGQAIVFTLQNHEERITENQKDIQILQKEIDNLKKQLAPRKELVV